MGDRSAPPVFRRESRSIPPRPRGIFLRPILGLISAYRVSRPRAAWDGSAQHDHTCSGLFRDCSIISPRPPSHDGISSLLSPWFALAFTARCRARESHSSAWCRTVRSYLSRQRRAEDWPVGHGWIVARQVELTLARELSGDSKSFRPAVEMTVEMMAGRVEKPAIAEGLGRVPREAPAFVVCLTACSCDWC